MTSSTLLSLLPFVLLIILLLGLGVKLLYSSFITAAFTFLLVLFHWQVPLSEISWAIIKALCLTTDMFLIVFGALIFQGFLKATGNFKTMIDELNNVSPSRWLLILTLSWCFGGFLEGISGFGAPAALLAPFLVGLGLAPLEAIIICLLANSTAVTFGAMGTPFRIGLSEHVSLELITYTAAMNLCVGIFIPLMMIHFLRRKNLAPKDTMKPYLWGALAGILFLIPYYGMSFFAIEFPTVIGGAFSYFAMILILKWKEKRPLKIKKLIWSFYPYWPVIILLFVGRYFFMGKGFHLKLGDHFQHTFNFFHPGFILLLVAFVIGQFQLGSLRFLSTIMKDAQKKLWHTTISLFCMSAVSTLFLVTEHAPIAGMLSSIGDLLAGSYFNYYSVFLGAFGSFLTGSATISNLLFAPLQVEVSMALHLNKDLILALQLSGAAMGNMISLLNIISVEGALNYSSNLKEVFFYLIPYCFLMLLLLVASQMMF